MLGDGAVGLTFSSEFFHGFDYSLLGGVRDEFVVVAFTTVGDLAGEVLAFFGLGGLIAGFSAGDLVVGDQKCGAVVGRS